MPVTVGASVSCFPVADAGADPPHQDTRASAPRPAGANAPRERLSRRTVVLSLPLPLRTDDFIFPQRRGTVNGGSRAPGNIGPGTLLEKASGHSVCCKVPRSPSLPPW